MEDDSASRLALDRLIQAAIDVRFLHPRKLSSPEAQALEEAILCELGL
jgi:hypothetical protein